MNHCDVWLVRWVGVVVGPGAAVSPGSGYYCRPARLPVVPSPGLGLAIDGDNDPVKVEAVYVNHNGAVVCDVEEARYKDDDVCRGTTDEIALQIGGHTTGWYPLDRFGTDAYRLPPLTGPFPPVHKPVKPLDPRLAG